MSDFGHVTRLLRELDLDDPSSEERLYRAVYDELRTQARRQLRGDRAARDFQPTELVNEGFLKLRRDLESVGWEWNSRKQFYFMSKRAMRQILLDYAERRTRLKRGGGAPHVGLDDAPPDALADEAAALFPDSAAAEEQLRLAAALQAFGAVSAVGREMFEMRYYTAFSHATIAECFGVSTKTVQRRLHAAEGWLADRLADS